MGLLNKSEKIFKVCSYLLVIVFALVTLYPIVYAFSVSISGKLAYESGLITLLPKDITLQAYEMVIESKGFWIAYANTLFYLFHFRIQVHQHPVLHGDRHRLEHGYFPHRCLCFAEEKAEIPPPVELFAGVYHVVQRRYDPPVSEL